MRTNDAGDSVAEVGLRGSRDMVLIDRADLELVSGFTWRAVALGDMTRRTYAQAQRGNLYLYMHRLIIGAGDRDLVDHVNRNGLDNRSANLRLCTSSQNQGNRGADRRRLGTTSVHKGVCWDKSRQRWGAYIHYDGRTRALGRFDSETSAALAYNVAAVERWGNFARLNIVEGLSDAS
jgi:hypothetical protein